MEKQNESFKAVKKALDLNCLFLEEVLALDFPSLQPDAKDLLFSQFKITIGRLGNIINRNV